MLQIPCPWCGPRAETEFNVGGEPRDRMVDDPGLDTAAWADRLYGRDNVRGMASELWWHVHGCQQWLLVQRDTVTHRVQAVAPVLDGSTGDAAVRAPGSGSDRLRGAGG